MLYRAVCGVARPQNAGGVARAPMASQHELGSAHAPRQAELGSTIVLLSTSASVSHQAPLANGCERAQISAARVRILMPNDETRIG